MPALPATPAKTNAVPPDFVGPDPRNYATDPGVAARALETVRRGYEACKIARGDLSEKWRERYAAWRAVRKRKTYHGRANITDPEVSKAIETIVARVEDAALGQYPYARGIPRELMDREQVEINESLIQAQLDQDKAEITLQELIKNTAIYGTGVLRCTWSRTSKRRFGRRPARKRLGTIGRLNSYEVFEEEKETSGPKVRIVELENLYLPNLNVRDIEDQDFVIERVPSVPLRELAALGEGAVENLDQISAADYSPGISYEDAAKAERAEIAGYTVELPTDSPYSALKKCDLLMYEGAFDIDDDGIEEDCWIWVANEKTVVKACENPYWHGERSYVMTHYILSPGEAYGICLFEWIDSLWCELCDTHNQNLDNKTYILNPVVVAGITAGLNENRLVMGPGRVIRSQGLASEIQPFVFPDMTATGWQAAGIIRQMIRETTGATDLLQGTGPGTDKATIFTGMLNEASQRIKHILRNIFSQAIGPLFQKIYALNGQYIDARQVVRLVGRSGFQFRPIHPDDFGKQIDFRAVGTGTLASVLQKNFGLERFFQLAAPYIQSGMIQVNLQAAMERYWTDALGYSDADVIFSPQGPQPLDPQQENLLIEQRQAVDVSPQDDDVGHLQVHLPLTQHPDTFVSDGAKAHVRDHYRQAQEKAQQQQLMAAMMTAQILAGGGGQPGAGAATPSGPNGNVARFGPDQGGTKEIAEKLAGRQG